MSDCVHHWYLSPSEREGKTITTRQKCLKCGAKEKVVEEVDNRKYHRMYKKAQRIPVGVDDFHRREG